MISEAKPVASLSSGLLARKGGAKPAMRPQAFGHVGSSLEDLGWNDMGDPQSAPDADQHEPSPAAALTPMPRLVDHEDAGSPPPAAAPPVVEQQRAIAQSFAAPAETKKAPRSATAKSAVGKAVAGKAVAGKAVAGRAVARPGVDKRRGKAAFTLRLDPDRHLRLRLACAITAQSAQQFVCDALDSFLETLPEIETLADQLPVRAAKRN